MTCTANFQLRGVHLTENEQVAVVGSSPSLGSWCPQPTCYLSRLEDDIYKLSIQVEQSSIEYKYVILKGGEIRWEGGGNREVLIVGEDIRCDDEWMSDGASVFVGKNENSNQISSLGAPEDEGAPSKADDPAVEEVNENTTNLENVSIADPSAEVIDENTPHLDNVASTEEPAKRDKKCDSDSRKEEALSTRDVPRSPLLLIDGIFRMCGRRTANAS